MELYKIMTKYLLSTFLILTCFAAKADTLASALNDCKKIAGDKERLACFDQIQPLVDQPEVKTQQGQSNTTSVVAPTKEQLVESFGKEHKTVSASQQQTTIMSKLTKLTTTPLGSSIFTFENGQIWRQVSTEYFYAEVGRNYEIERGALNSFFLSEQGKRREIKVRRDK
jgi:hypothetical protein